MHVNRKRQRHGRPQLAALKRLAAVAWCLLALLSVAATWAQQDSIQTSDGTVRSVPAYRAAARVAVITIQGPIDAITSMSVQRRITDAEQAGADAIVIELDTPGGEVGAVLEICSAIENSAIENTVAWVHDSAYSGGAIVALSCREIVVSKSSSFGDAKVVGFSPMVGMIEPDDVQKEKIYPVLFERIDAFTKRHNESLGRYARDELLSQAIVADDAELWWVHDRTTGVRFAIDRAEFEKLYPDEPVLQPVLADAIVGSVAPPAASDEPPIADPDAAERPTNPPSGGFTPASPDVERVQRQIEEQIAISESRTSLRPIIDFNDPARYQLEAKLLSGRGAVVIGSNDMVRYGFAANVDLTGTRADPVTNDEQLMAFFQAEHLERFDASWSESLVRFMSSLPVKGLLVVVFLLGLFLEMTHPGLVLPGAVALVALLALVIPPYMIGAAGWWAIAAILGGILFILLEIFVFPGFGVPGVVGLLALFAGLLGIFLDTGQQTFPGIERDNTGVLYSLATLLLSGGVSLGGMFVIAKNFGRLPVINRLILKSEHDPDQPTLLSVLARKTTIPLGTQGVTLTVLRPSGRMQLFTEESDDSASGDVIDVVSSTGYIDPGVRVHVVEADGFRVVVEAVETA